MAQKTIETRGKASKQGYLYIFLGIIIMMCLGTVYSWSVFRIHIENTFQIGSTQSGLPYMLYLAVFALFMIVTGRFLDKTNPRMIILVGGLLVGLGWFLSGFANNVYTLSLTYGIITGAGVGIVYGVPIAVVTRWFPKGNGIMVGLVLIGFGISPLVTAPLARSLIEHYGILTTFRILGLSFGFLIAALSLPFRYPDDASSRDQQTSADTMGDVKSINTSDMVKTTTFKGLYLSFFAGTTIGLMLIGMTSNVGVNLIGLPEQTVTLFMSLFAIFNGLGRPTFGLLTDKLSIRKAMLISFGLILTAALLMLLPVEGNPVLFGFAFSIFWFNLGGWLAMAPAATLALFGRRYYGQNYGLVYSAYGIGAIIGVLSSGFLLDMIHNYDPIFYLVIVVCAAGIFTSQRMIKSSLP